jgi:alpha-tubulin suppressor-like RCC1 family protein
MSKSKFEIPIWAKIDKPVWVESFDSSGKEVVEYFEGNIVSIDEAARQLAVRLQHTNEERTIKSNVLLERNPLPTILNDLADTLILNDAELLKHLELRFRKSLIHSYCGPTLLIVNPYRRVEHEMADETREEILSHLKRRSLANAKPHIWTTSSIAFDSMIEQQRNQAICISGESGSGKTESTKRCLEFITQIKSASKTVFKVSVEEQILRCNPLLECLGNAKTQVNDNSSRFGKYSVLFIDKVKRNVRGASIQNYLLEKSRVTNLGKDERSYHVFYSMCRFMPSELRQKYLLNNNGNNCVMEQFRYLSRSGLYATPRVNDQEFFDDVMHSLQFLDFGQHEQEAFWKTLSAVLQIGNIEVDISSFEEGSSGCSVTRNQAFRNVTALLGVDQEVLEKGLTHRKIKIGAEVNWAPSAPDKVRSAVDTLARELYSRLFNWVIKRLNRTLHPKSFDESSFLTIGILDIFGFEIFKSNSLEQLFINFANERLQGLYIDYIFKNEKRIFEEEGLSEYTHLIVYKDNKPIIEALENNRSPPGTFDLLDQMSNTNRTDKEYFNELKRLHKPDILYYPSIIKNDADYNFSVRHTARDVQYFTLGFVEKNTEELQVALYEAVQTGQEDVVGVFNEALNVPLADQALSLPPGGKKQTLSVKFRKSMDDLIKQLGGCNCHFVRCLKPNELKKADFWNPLLVLQQIRYMGLLDSLKIRKNSFPFRYTYQSFFEIFQDLDMSGSGNRNFKTLVKEEADFGVLVKELLKHCGVEFGVKDLLFGKTKVFLNERLKVALERALQLSQRQKREALAVIQAAYRTHLMKATVREETVRMAGVISLSRDFLCSWGAKAEAMKFKRLIRLVVRLQLRYRRVVQRRQARLKAFNMLLIVKHLNLYKFSTKVNYLYFFKNKVRMLSEMLDRKMKESKVKFCRSVVEQCVNKAWSVVLHNQEHDLASLIQRSYRSHLLRAGRTVEITAFRKRVLESKANNAAKTIQKHVRGFLVRSRLSRLVRAANRVKGFFRTRWLRTYFLRVREATGRIQRAMRKYFVRKHTIEASLGLFMKTNGTLVESVRRLEHAILFADFTHPANLTNVDDFVRMPFYEHSRTLDFGSGNFKLFLPGPAKVASQVRLFALPIDLNVHIDSTNVYERTWAFEFVNVMKGLAKKQQNLIHVEVGESFTVALTDENEVFTWGLNDFGQCGYKIKRRSKVGVGVQENEGFCSFQKKNKGLGGVMVRAVSAGKDHALMVDEGNCLVGWGRCDDRQLVNRAEGKEGLWVLDSVQFPVKGVVSREHYNYLLSGEGKVYGWLSKDSDKLTDEVSLRHRPDCLRTVPSTDPVSSSRNGIQLLSFSESVTIGLIELGTDFALFLSEQGLVYSCGQNEFGQLGHGHQQTVSHPQVVAEFKSRNEKVAELSAGHKHFVAKTSVGNLFTCGYNRQGQLGLGDCSDRSTPAVVKLMLSKSDSLVPLKVQAGVTFTMVLMINKQVWFAGNSGSQRADQFSCTLTRLDYESKAA